MMSDLPDIIELVLVLAAFPAAGLLSYYGFVKVRRLAREDSATPDARSHALEDRLTRIEHAVDAIAIEVERGSEAQRFTARLLAERLAADAMALPATAGVAARDAHGRVLTPH
jgi:hypothetical protein